MLLTPFLLRLLALRLALPVMDDEERFVLLEPEATKHVDADVGPLVVIKGLSRRG